MIKRVKIDFKLPRENPSRIINKIKIFHKYIMIFIFFVSH